MGKITLPCIVLFFFLVSSGCTAENLEYWRELQQQYIQKGKFSLVKDNLYEGDNGELYFKVERRKLNTENDENIFRKRFSYPDEDKEYLDPTLSEKVDKSSWKQLSTFFYMDNKSVYCFIPDLGGGRLEVMEGVDSAYFKFYYDGAWHKYEDIFNIKKEAGNEFKKGNVVSWYITDGNTVYYKCSDIEQADLKSFKVVRHVDGFVSAHLAVDRFNIYSGDAVMPAEEYLAIAKEYSVSNDKDKQKFSKAMFELIGARLK